MTMPSLIWGSPQSLATALLLLGVAAVTLVWSYSRARTSRSVKLGGAILKALGFLSHTAVFWNSARGPVITPGSTHNAIARSSRWTLAKIA